MNITEKVAYIKGLMEGMELDTSNPQSKVLSSIVNLLEDISLEISDINKCYDEVVDQLDAVDEDLYLLEENFYSDEDCSCGCEEEDNGIFYEVTCPTCGETVCVSEPVILDGSIDCPNCGENLEFDLDGLSFENNCECSDDCECGTDCDCTEDSKCNDTCTCN